MRDDLKWFILCSENLMSEQVQAAETKACQKRKEAEIETLGMA